jgi:hypothetical protein
MGQSLGIYRNEAVYAKLLFKWIGVYTTASDCSGPFDWSESDSLNFPMTPEVL